MKNLLKNIEPNLTKEKEEIWNIVKYMIKSNLSYEILISDSIEKGASISKWLYNINPKFIRKYLHDVSIDGVVIKTKNNGYEFNTIKADANYIMKISDNGYIAYTSITKRIENTDECIIKVIFFGKDAYINYKKYIIFNKKFKNKMFSSRIKFISDSGNENTTNINSKWIDKRDLNTVYSNNNIHKKICDMYIRWANNKEFYKKLCITNKLGILLKGPVGSGKSTIARLLASQEFNAILISPNITRVKESLNKIISSYTILSNTIKIILLEDIDTVLNKPIKNMDPKEAENARNLLQILDSNESPDNTVFIATTNYYDKLIKNVPNLVRPGRFDIVEEIGYLNKETADKMINNFNNSIYEFNNFKINPNDVYEVHSKKYPKLKYEYSPAAIQSIMIELMNEKVFDK